MQRSIEKTIIFIENDGKPNQWSVGFYQKRKLVV